jgi:alanine racemase
MSRATTAHIHTGNLRHNFSIARQRAPHARAMAVVKADGYGHGLERVANALRSADLFGVAMLADAERLRAIGITQPIVLLSGFDAPEDLALLRQLNVTTAVHSHEQLRMLEAAGPGEPIQCWLKIDSGMHRLGFAPEHVRDAHTLLTSLPHVASEIALMTHFASSDEFANSASRGEATLKQLRVFEETTAGLPGPRSLANSAAVLGWPQVHGDIIRPGGMLYGMSLVEGVNGDAFGLRPAMSFTARLIAVKQMKQGEAIGYSATWRCPENMPVGVAAVGYGDGYPRVVPPAMPVVVNGRPASIVGRVSMDLMTIDLRNQPDARVGDEVLLWGEGLPVETVACTANTISYELTCGITKRVRFVED